MEEGVDDFGSSAPGGSIGGAAARSAALLVIAGCLRYLLLGPAADAPPQWSPLLFLAALGCVGLVWQRRIARPVPAPGPAAGGRRALRMLLVVSLCFLPAALSLAYVTGIGAAPDSVGPGWAALLAAIVLYVLAAPLVEEFYFRRLLHREFSVLFGRPFTVVAANAVWFAAIHAPQNIPVALAVGLCCTTLRILTGSLRLPVMAHAVTNLALVIAGH